MASNNYIVKDTALRYVVPFTYEGKFDLACEKIEKQHIRKQKSCRKKCMGQKCSFR